MMKPVRRVRHETRVHFADERIGAGSSLEQLEPRRLLSAASSKAQDAPTPVCTCAACTGARQSSAALNVELTPTPIPTSRQKTAMRSAFRAAVADVAGKIGLANTYEPLERFTRTDTIHDAVILPATSFGVSIDFSDAARQLADGTRKGRSFVVALPAPDGTLQRFTVARNDTLSAGLAAQQPNLLTFSGVNVDNPSITLALDLTTLGLHASVLGGADGAWYLDPYFRFGTSQYISYFTKDRLETPSWECDTHDFDDAARAAGADAEGGGLASGDLATDGKLRTYDFVVATTGEYTTYHGGAANALSTVATVTNRLNQIYERDLGVRLSLVPQTSAFIYPTASTDPFTSANNPDASNAVAQGLFDSAALGSANYDVGHVFHRVTSAGSNNGLAGGIGTVGRAGIKGEGYSAYNVPVGDNFTVDYVAHELGHQFGGRHSFSSAGGGPGDSTSLAVEPGSGTTIMSYAGIGTSSENLQAHSDAMFHSQSIEQIYTYLTSNSQAIAGATLTSTGNTAPAVSIGSTLYRIPTGTPFALTANATDDGPLDALTYSWEQRNGGSGVLASPTGTSTSGPLFRAKLPVASPTRMFPQLSTILTGGTGGVGEKLSNVARTLTFTVAVRDNNAGAGATTTVNTSVQVVNTGSAFALTSHNAASTLTGGSNINLTWNVAGTTANNINVANVRLLMSTDNGNTFAYTLAESTANDGSESVQLPYGVGSSQVRFKVEAIGNIFFDINNAAQTLVNVPIVSATPGVPLLSTASDSGVSQTDGITNFDNSNAGKALEFTVPGTVAGALVELLVDGIVRGSATAAGASTFVTTDGAIALADGLHAITARQTETGKPVSAASAGTAVTIDTVAPDAPHLLDLASSSDTGVLNDDNLTNDTSPTLIFAAEPGVYFRLSRDGAPVGADYLAESSIDDSGLDDGTHTYSLLTVDAAGNVNATPLTLAITIDTVAPDAPTLLDLDAATDSGVADDDNITNVSIPTILTTGSGPGDYVRLYRNGSVVGFDYSTSDSISESGLPDGVHHYELYAVDAAGNLSVVSLTLDVTIDTAAPVLLEPGWFQFETQQTLLYRFGEDVGATIGGATLTVTTAGGEEIAVTVVYDPLTFSTVVHFAAPLADDDYVATLTGVTDLAGNVTAGEVVNFFWLNGDANRDRKVDFDDLLTLAQNYGGVGLGYSAGNFDYDAEGKVDFDDLLLLAQQYGKSLEPLAPARKRPH